MEGGPALCRLMSERILCVFLIPFRFFRQTLLAICIVFIRSCLPVDKPAEVKKGNQKNYYE